MYYFATRRNDGTNALLVFLPNNLQILASVMTVNRRILRSSLLAFYELQSMKATSFEEKNIYLRHNLRINESEAIC